MVPLTTLASIIGFAALISAQLTPDTIVSSLEELAAKSQLLLSPVYQINIENGPRIEYGQGPLPAVIAGFADIIAQVEAIDWELRDLPPIPAGPQSDAIYDSFYQFSRIHQEILEGLIERGKLFKNIPVIGRPIAAILRADKKALGFFVSDLVKVVTVLGPKLTLESTSLSNVFDQVVKEYNSIAIPARGNPDASSKIADGVWEDIP